MDRLLKTALLLCLVLASLLLLPALALAGARTGSGGVALAFSPTQLWVLVLGGISPLIGYVFNHYAPWASETIKLFVQGLIAAGVGAAYVAIETGAFGWNSTTLQMIVTAIIGFAMAHSAIWKIGNVNTLLGAGSNHPFPLNAAHPKQLAIAGLIAGDGTTPYGADGPAASAPATSSSAAAPALTGGGASTGQ